jgi:hypothetical protein
MQTAEWVILAIRWLAVGVFHACLAAYWLTVAILRMVWFVLSPPSLATEVQRLQAESDRLQAEALAAARLAASRARVVVSVASGTEVVVRPTRSMGLRSQQRAVAARKTPKGPQTQGAWRGGSQATHSARQPHSGKADPPSDAG